MVTTFLYQGYISIFGAAARLLSNWGANFMSSIIDQMCTLLGMKKLRTMAYHPQTNRLVERSHQTIMQMIRKLGEDKKANWPGHLAEIVQAYNGTQSAVMGYSQHYLMFGCRQRLLVDFYFPSFRSVWEAPPPSVWINMWQLSMTNWGPPSGKFGPSQQQKPNNKNGTMTER